MGLSQEKSNAPYPYHWFQHIFAHLVKTDTLFSKIWDSCPSKSIVNPHLLQYWVREELIHKNFKTILTEESIKNIVENSEMQKLNWRMAFPIKTLEKYSVSVLNKVHTVQK